MSQYFRDRWIEGTAPGTCSTANERGRERQVARAAKHDFSRLDQPAGELAEAIDTVFADTDDG